MDVQEKGENKTLKWLWSKWLPKRETNERNECNGHQVFEVEVDFGFIDLVFGINGVPDFHITIREKKYKIEIPW
jgi:hypothetical protein